MADRFQTLIRTATAADVPTVLRFVRELAAYEKLTHEVIATEDDLRRTLFGERPVAEVVILEELRQPANDSQPQRAEAAAFALFFHNYSTFLGQPGLYLEDLYVRPEARGRGHGQRLLAHLAELAVERDCGRLEWSVLDWNEPAIGFYRKLGAVAMDGWTVFRLTGAELRSLAARPGA